MRAVVVVFAVGTIYVDPMKFCEQPPPPYLTRSASAQVTVHAPVGLS